MSLTGFNIKRMMETEAKEEPTVKKTKKTEPKPTMTLNEAENTTEKEKE